MQDKAAMKLGTDSVLLGCFTKIDRAKCIVDIGTGTGILALMMAQKSNALIDAVEIDEEAFKQAEQNAIESPWHDRIKVHHTAIQNFQASQKYDIIISNPPYYRNAKNMGIEDEKRALARHDKGVGRAEGLDGDAEVEEGLGVVLGGVAADDEGGAEVVEEVGEEGRREAAVAVGVDPLRAGGQAGGGGLEEEDLAWDHEVHLAVGGAAREGGGE